jgi:[ribosomal protein S5]-alanine N-acetyltransferase
MKLVEISFSGEAAEPIERLPTIAADIGAAYVALYSAAGYVRPWLGYFALEDSVCIGTCGFKGPPQNNRVEIAYFTFPEYEQRGYARRMARMLVEMAQAFDKDVIIAAQTLPKESASTAILRRLGFVLMGSIDHPEDGEVWEWQLPNNALRTTYASASA